MKISSRVIIVAMAATIAVGCNQNIEQDNHLNFVLDCNFDAMVGDTAYLKVVREGGYEFVDSSRVDAKGHFDLEGSISKPDFYILHFASNLNKQITLIPDTSQHIVLNAHGTNYDDEYEVTGSPESESVCSLVRTLCRTRMVCDSLGKIFRENLGASNLAGIKQVLDSVYWKRRKEQRKFSEDFIKNNPNSLAQIVCLSQYVAPRNPVFDPSADYEIYKGVSDRLLALYPDNLHTRRLVSYVDKIKLSVQDGGKVSDMPAVGSTAHNVALRGINGDTVRLSSMKGKFILLDFCASWSNVSAANTENLLKLYTRYKGSNLAIYQVYLEESRSAWVKYVKENKIPWTTASSVSLWNCQAAQAYGVTSLPATFLIYPDFTIQGVNMTADKLDAQLSEVLTKTSKKK